MEEKRTVATLYARVRLPRSISGASSQWSNAWMMREVLAAYPLLVDNLLSIRESIFSRDSNGEGWFHWFGATAIAVQGSDLSALKRVLEEGSAAPDSRSPAFSIDGFPERIKPGRYSSLRLMLSTSLLLYAEATERLSQYLRLEHIPATAVRNSFGYEFQIAPKYRRKGIMYAGSIKFH
jgi:hypothetical protein